MVDEEEMADRAAAELLDEVEEEAAERRSQKAEGEVTGRWWEEVTDGCICPL